MVDVGSLRTTGGFFEWVFSDDEGRKGLVGI